VFSSVGFSAVFSRKNEDFSRFTAGLLTNNTKQASFFQLFHKRNFQAQGSFAVPALAFCQQNAA